MPISESRSRARRRNATANASSALSLEERQAYAKFCDDYVTDLQTKTEEERELAEKMARLRWEIDRCRALEARLFNSYAREHAAEPISGNPEVDRALHDAMAFMANSKELDKISAQEYRLHGHWLRAMKQFGELQAQREAKERQNRMQKRPWVH